MKTNQITMIAKLVNSLDDQERAVLDEMFNAMSKGAVSASTIDVEQYAKKFTEWCINNCLHHNDKDNRKMFLTSPMHTFKEWVSNLNDCSIHERYTVLEHKNAIFTQLSIDDRGVSTYRVNGTCTKCIRIA